MKKTYKITLPKGAKVYTIDAKADDGVLNVTLKMEQKYMPKDGDIVYAQRDGDRSNYKWIFIYKKALTDPYKRCDVYAYLGIECDGKTVSELHFDDHCSTQEFLRPATEAEKKCIEDLPRWRAEVGSDYYLIERDLTIRTQKDLRWKIDDSIHNAGNYFRTREAAEKVASQIRDIFKNSKAE